MKYRHPKEHTERIVRKRIALIPVTAKNPKTKKLETRWLEEVFVKQRYLCGNTSGFWSNVEFVDEE